MGVMTASDPSMFHHLRDPAPDAIGESVHQFLQSLPGPTHIHLSGRDSSRSRALVTLLHGNEPSGLTALYHLIKKGVEPAVDIHCFLPGVDIAKVEPEFYYRHLPDGSDLNRCFKAPFEGPEGQLAKTLLDQLAQLQPEALLDIHNTSGSGPSFGVTTFMDRRHDALVSLFTQRMIVTNLKLGALMEISEILLPTVTIECGGAQDPESSLLAEEGLFKYFTQTQVLTPPDADFGLEFFHNPVRLEMQNGGEVRYGDRALTRQGITLKTDIEHHNFNQVCQQTPLAYLDSSSMQYLTAKTPAGIETLNQHFEIRDGVLFPRHPLKLFMITSIPEIAQSDCLFYLVPVEAK